MIRFSMRKISSDLKNSFKEIAGVKQDHSGLKKRGRETCTLLLGI